MRPPGDLDDLGETGRTAWDHLVKREAARVLAELEAAGRAPTHLLAAEKPGGDTRTIEWPAFPIRVAAEHTVEQAMVMLDERDPTRGDTGRAAHQEEYAEWRLIRDDNGEARGIEMTTELRDYWTVMAAHDPARTLELVALLSGEPAVDPTGVYGPEIADPLDLETAPGARAAGFERTMLPSNRENPTPFSPYNDGRRALCCMVHPSNNLGALLELAFSAARSLLVDDEVTGRRRFPSGGEAIAGLEASARDGRNSDPLLVERIVGYAGDGLRVGLDDPAGIYIGELQLHELEQPDGEDVPRRWLQLSRGIPAEKAPDGRNRSQRLKFALPPDTDFALEDLVVRRTGEKLRHGGQLASLVALRAYLRTAPGGEAAS